jgi:hypothetical protein
MVRYFRKQDGTFAGVWLDGAPDDPALVEVPAPPADGRMIWDGSGWAMPLSLAQELATEAIQAMLDGAAKARNYESSISLASYVNSTNTEWAAEAQGFVAWRDAVWATAYTILADVAGGIRPMPGSIDELIAELPAQSW